MIDVLIQSSIITSVSIDEDTLVENYFSIASNNFILSLPLQLVIMGPFNRFVFAKFVKGQRMAESFH